MADRERSNEKEASVLHRHFAHHTVSLRKSECENNVELHFITEMNVSRGCFPKYSSKSVPTWKNEKDGA